MKTVETILGVINPAALSALRIAGALFLAINFLSGIYIFRHRHRFFGRDPKVDNDIPAVRHMRVEVIFIPWLALTALLVIEWLKLWFE